MLLRTGVDSWAFQMFWWDVSGRVGQGRGRKPGERKVLQNRARGGRVAREGGGQGREGCQERDKYGRAEKGRAW